LTIDVIPGAADDVRVEDDVPDDDGARQPEDREDRREPKAGSRERSVNHAGFP
jgi:hypothetical protein